MSSYTRTKRPIDISPSSEFTAIKIKRQDFDGSFLLVEGITDSKLFRKLLDCNSCNIRPVEGKENVLEIIKLANKSFEPGILSIIDADFDHISGFEYEHTNILRTETYDLEGLMLKSKALDFLLEEKSDKQKLKKFLQEKNIRTILLSKAQSIGYLRLTSLESNWKIKFSNMQFDRFVEKETLEIILDELVSAVRDITLYGDFYKEDMLEIIKILENFKSPTDDLWLICNGHDLMNILSIGLKFIFGKIGKEFHTKEIEWKLRDYYNLSYFKTTQLYNCLRTWEERNKPYKVLK